MLCSARTGDHQLPDYFGHPVYREPSPPVIGISKREIPKPKTEAIENEPKQSSSVSSDLVANFGEEEVKTLVVRLAELAVEAQRSQEALKQLQGRAELLKQRLQTVRRVKKDRPVRDIADEIHRRVKLLESITKHRGIYDVASSLIMKKKTSVQHVILRFDKIIVY